MNLICPTSLFLLDFDMLILDTCGKLEEKVHLKEKQRGDGVTLKLVTWLGLTE